jgi:hypothetical protein
LTRSRSSSVGPEVAVRPARRWSTSIATGMRELSKEIDRLTDGDSSSTEIRQRRFRSPHLSSASMVSGLRVPDVVAR